jgi:uncharacterized membrane protein YhaH (DUF805 family)
MDFGTAVRVCLRKYATFSGRASRSELWWFVLFECLVSAAASVLDVGIGASDVKPITALAGLALLLPSLAVAVRRLHDIDYSGWWILIIVIPVLGALALLVFYCLAGSEGDNRFGPPASSPPSPALRPT